MLVLLEIALGRDSISLRLVAVGALIVLPFRPEALAGPSFQFSFAAVRAIIALHSSGLGRRLLLRRDEGPIARTLRVLLGMVLTGLAVEIALIPFALYHFHKAGLFGGAANLVAIPLTTLACSHRGQRSRSSRDIGFDAELALCADGGGRAVAVSLDDQAAPVRLRPLAVGAVAAFLSPTPDLLVTGDGRHLAVVATVGRPMMLRDRSGDFMRDLISEASMKNWLAGRGAVRVLLPRFLRRSDSAGRAGIPTAGDALDEDRLATLVQACAQADIAVSDRWLPRSCAPRWLKLDRKRLEQTGGVALYLDERARVKTVSEHLARHPWAM